MLKLAKGLKDFNYLCKLYHVRKKTIQCKCKLTIVPLIDFNNFSNKIGMVIYSELEQLG